MVADGKRPESRLDRVLDVIDVGLQRSSEELGCGQVDCPLCNPSVDVPIARLDPEQLQELFGPLAPTILAIGEQAAATAVAVIQLVPPELNAVATELYELEVEGQALGLSPERCEAVICEVLSEAERTLDSVQAVPARARLRLLHESGNCSCATTGLCPVGLAE